MCCQRIEKDSFSKYTTIIMSQEHKELIDYTELYTATTLPYEESPGETQYYTTDNPGDCIYSN